MKNLRTISLLEWIICALGMFFIGVGASYISFGIFKYGLIILIIGLILEIPAFYLVYKHK
jgi:hypothetical protein